MKKKKINIFVVILCLLAVFMVLNHLALAIIPFAPLEYPPWFEAELHFVAYPILVVLIAFFSTFCNDLYENRIWISGGLVLNVIIWVVGVLLIVRRL